MTTPLEYPIQLSKVQAPPLRDDTLARDRLLDWLSIKIHGRVVLLVAEAGYGKTTLLADFSRRTRVRVLWFRLDRGDRDWVGFIAHLVAAVRVYAPGFGSATAAMLGDAATSTLSLERVMDTFLKELAGQLVEPTALVFDDVHLVDDSPDVREVLRELLTRGPERMSFVFASRREPPLRLARLRARGEVAELDTNDLRFDESETERLFRETYEMRLEPSVLAELNRRTEGWAASLQLVRAAIRDRDPVQVRAFVSSLSGAEGHLYEYLAEEVVGDLPSDLQQFLMRTSVLDTVDLTLGPVAAGISEAKTQRYLDEAERYGLFGKGGQHSRNTTRAHPLVRDFLQARLLRAIGENGARGIHVAVAMAAEQFDWQAAARHYVAAGSREAARRVIASAIDVIQATGAYAAAGSLSAIIGPEDLPGAVGLVIKSRLAQQRADVDEALALAEQAWALDPASTAALLNLATARGLAGDLAGALEASGLLEQADGSGFASMGRAYQRTLETSLSGSVDDAKRELEELITALRERQAAHHLGVALHNLAQLLFAQGAFAEALDRASEAIGLLESSSAGNELNAARSLRASTLAFLGSIGSARDEIDRVLEVAPPGQALELAADYSMAEAMAGESAMAWPLMRSVSDLTGPETDIGEQALYARAHLHIQDGEFGRAMADLAQLRHGEPRSSIAFEARRSLAEGLCLALRGDAALERIAIGATLARTQQATFWAIYGDTLLALADGSRDPSDAVRRAFAEAPAVPSALAEMCVRRLADLDEAALREIRDESERRPWRWRPESRRSLGSADVATRRRAAELLEVIGEPADVALLRDASKGTEDRRGPRPGYRLARRLANRVFVDDLGRVRISVGARVIDGGEIRRKVLALICLLLSKARFASTREEVLDSLWPEHDPDSALNSLNQTVYFLRRVFEPDFRDDVSPGYVGQDTETIWLDPALIDSRSRRCLEIIRAMPGDPTPEGAFALAQEYQGRFALDFAYEDWSAAYRDALHAGYLRVMERALRLDLDSGHFARGAFIAERAAEVDPDAEEIQVALVRLYRHSGAHAAAAEWYGHYASTLRGLGIDPPPLSDV